MERNGFMFKKAIGYVEQDDLLGAVVGVDFRRNNVTLIDGDGKESVYDSNLIEFLEEVFELNGMTIFNKDVISEDGEKLYQVELHDSGQVQLHLLSDKLEIVASGDKFTQDEVSEVVLRGMGLVGNIYELLSELPQAPDFNIKTVREFEDGNVTYFYACNNKEKEEIDLIKVLFVGHHLLEEEDYTRITLSHEVYLDSINSGTLKEINPQELMNYITGISSFKEDEVDDEEPVDDWEVKCGYEKECLLGDRDCQCKENEGCTNCGADNYNCDCNLW